MKIQEALAWGSQILEKEGLPSPRLDSEVLMMNLLGLERTGLYLSYLQELDQGKEKIFQDLVKKRKERTPIAYLIGKKEFMSLDFQVDSRVLIPRPETELLVEAILREMKNYLLPVKVLDIGTGSGAIAISLAHYHQQSIVYALDYSSEALTVATNNAQSLGLEDRVHFLQGDLWSALLPEQRNRYFQVIVSNPPYISCGEMLTLGSEVADYEPHLALEAGEDGLDFYRRIAAGLADYLAVGGLVALEVGQGQAGQVKKLLEDTKIFSRIEILLDYAEISRIVLAWREK